jgi:microcystin-dependent protein
MDFLPKLVKKQIDQATKRIAKGTQNTGSFSPGMSLQVETQEPSASLAEHEETYTHDDISSTKAEVEAARGAEDTLADRLTSIEFPSGGIIMWNGSVASIPLGWVLCDGTNGTPNLTDKFIMGAGNSYAVGATGGEASHVINGAQLPTHSHVLSSPTMLPDYGDTTTINVAAGTDHAIDIPNVVDATLNLLPAGGLTALPNIPPYYALCYIMKT